jgi:hypothetical protein
MSSFKHPPVVDINTARADSFVGGGGSLVSYEPDKAHSPLALIEKAEQALEKASTIDVVKGIRDQAEVLRLYAKQARKSFEMQNQCAEIKLRAERKAGHMLSEQDKNKGAAVSAENADDIPRLKDIGISYSQSSRWQAIAGIPDEVFEKNLDKLREACREITSAVFLRLAAKLNKERDQDGAGKTDLNIQPNQSETNETRSRVGFEQALEILRKVILESRADGWNPLSKEEVEANLRLLLGLITTSDHLDQ